MKPHFELEDEAGGLVAGVDEAGRGPLAGPVVAASVLFTRGVPPALRPLIDDSKRLSAPAREHAARSLWAEPGVFVGVGAASVPEIARLNILHAAMLAMHRAVSRLAVAPSLVLVDGDRLPALPCPGRAVVRGDATSLSIAAASIVAKVVRDRVMARLALRHPCYGWDVNAGYGTVQHRAALHEYGITRHHRAGFGTVRRVLAGKTGENVFRAVSRDAH